jgi:hypothetical protein
VPIANIAIEMFYKCQGGSKARWRKSNSNFRWNFALNPTTIIFFGFQFTENEQLLILFLPYHKKPFAVLAW